MEKLSVPSSEVAYIYIKRSILNQVFSSGQKLNYGDIEARLQMSKTPIIQALSRLMEEGLVSYRKNHGYFVEVSREVDMKSDTAKKLTDVTGLSKGDNGEALFFSQNHQSLNDAVYKRIKKLIFSFRLAPGQKLIYKDLSQELWVSKTPIINALIRLESEGYVVHKKNAGYYIKKINLTEVLHMYQARELFECANTDLILDNISKKDLLALDEIHQEFVADTSEGYGETKIEIDRRFHIRLAEIGGNSFVIKTIREIYEQYHLSLKLSLRFLPLQRVEEVDKEHERIIESLLASDRSGLKRAMEEHLHAPVLELGQYLKSRETPADEHETSGDSIVNW